MRASIGSRPCSPRWRNDHADGRESASRPGRVGMAHGRDRFGSNRKGAVAQRIRSRSRCSLAASESRPGTTTGRRRAFASTPSTSLWKAGTIASQGAAARGCPPAIRLPPRSCCRCSVSVRVASTRLSAAHSPSATELLPLFRVRLWRARGWSSSTFVSRDDVTYGEIGPRPLLTIARDTAASEAERARSASGCSS
jgi:hypothetical protein